MKIRTHAMDSGRCYFLFRLRALKSPWYSETFPLVVAGGSIGSNGSESVPRKSSETFRGTTSVDDERALKSPWNSETFPLAVAGGSTGPNGSESVPRKSSEIFRGTTSVDHVPVCDIIAGGRRHGIVGETVSFDDDVRCVPIP